MLGVVNELIVATSRVPAVLATGSDAVMKCVCTALSALICLVVMPPTTLPKVR